MTLYWSNWVYQSGNGMRVGMEAYNYSAVDTNSSTFTFTVDFWTGNQYNYNDLQTLNYTGGSLGYNNTQASGTSTKRYTRSYSCTFSGWGPGTGCVTTVHADVADTYNGVLPGLNLTITSPYRPFAPPYSPTGVTAVRNSDSQATISGTHPSDAQHPVVSMSILKHRYSGSTWYDDGIIYTGGGTSFANTTISANRVYNYAMRLNNSSGSSPWVFASSYVYTTPAAPTSVKAALISDTQIKVSWTNNHYVNSNVSLSIERSIAGGAWTSVATGLSHTTTSWIDTSPGMGSTNQYRVWSTVSIGPLSSSKNTSNSITTYVAPLAPNMLAPDGLARDGTATIAVTWVHRDGGDGADQTSYRIRYSVDGSTWTTSSTISSTASTHTFAAGTFTNGTTYQWQVQTTGVASAGAGPYSASATIVASAKPVGALTGPASTINVPTVVPTWTYTQSSGSVQTWWQCELWNAANTTLLELKTGSDNALTTSFAYPAQDNTSYLIWLRVQSAAGLKSNWVSRTVTVDILPPAGTTMTGTYNACTGTVTLTVTALADTPGTTAPVEWFDIERKIEGQDEWAMVARNVDIAGTVPVAVLDPIPLTNGTNEYRCTSRTAGGAALIGSTISVEGTDGGGDGSGMWVFLAYGENFENILRFSGDPAIGMTDGRARMAHSFAGRQFPVLVVGEARKQSLTVSGTLNYFYAEADCAPGEEAPCVYDSPPVDWENMAWNAEVVCYRDWRGRRVFALLGDVTVSEVQHAGLFGVATLSIAMSRVDWDETARAATSTAVPSPAMLADEETLMLAATTMQPGR